MPPVQSANCSIAYAGWPWQVGLQLHLIKMMHTQDSVQKAQSHKASCITVSKPLNHLQLRLCLFKFCLSTVRSHFIPDLISGLQVFNRMCSLICAAAWTLPQHSQCCSPLFHHLVFWRQPGLLFARRLGACRCACHGKPWPGHLSCPSKRLGKFGSHPFAAVAISIWALGSVLFSSLRFSGGDHGGPCRSAHRRSPGASVGRPPGGAHAT